MDWTSFFTGAVAMLTVSCLAALLLVWLLPGERESPAITEYKRLHTSLLARRALGPLPMDDEYRITEKLLGLWALLSTRERAALEEWLESHKPGAP